MRSAAGSRFVSEALLASVNELKLSEGPPGEFCILGIRTSARFLEAARIGSLLFIFADSPSY
jgi:hypothetical protein